MYTEVRLALAVIAVAAALVRDWIALQSVNANLAVLDHVQLRRLEQPGERN
jgi:hypothetical protein